jgi:hypothetical protein
MTSSLWHDTLIYMEAMTVYESPAVARKAPRLKTLIRSTSPELPTLRLTKRDIQIINACYEYRALTTIQIQKLIFDQGEQVSQQRCQHRLKLLFHHGYLHRDEQPTKLSDGRRPLIYFLDRKGAQLLAGYLSLPVSELDWDLKDTVAGASHLFIDHLLKTNDVRIAITLATQKENATIEQWIDDKTLRSRQMKDYVTLLDAKQNERKMAIVPDGYFHLAIGERESHHFLETDMCTVVGLSTKSGRRDWAKKIRSYLAYHESRQFQERYHVSSFRVLTVTTGERRLANLKKITEEAGGKSRFWFTTFEQLTSDTALSQPIWQIAGREGEYSLVLSE